MTNATDSTTVSYFQRQIGPAFVGADDLARALAPIATTGAPSANADFLGQKYINTSNGAVYIAVAVGTGASDWSITGLTGISAAEIGVLDGAVAGTPTASKAVVADANTNLGGVKATSLAVGASGSEVTIDATPLEINMAADVSANTEIVTSTNVIAATESGKTFFLNSATEFVSTLPAPAQGLKFSFIVTAAPSGASYTIVTNASANIIKGQIYTLDVNSATDSDFETSGGDTVTLTDGKSVAGDRVDVVCDGTYWFVYGFCSVFDAITITTAS